MNKKTVNILINSAITIGILFAALAVCFILKAADNTSSYASMIFILAVFLIARFTDKFCYGIISSLAGVLMVNFVFTYPYFEFNFTLSGYPIFMLSMLVVSIATSALTTRNKNQEKLRIETEREKTRSNLLRAISHDIRTPLTSINGACTAMIENDLYISAEERIKLLNDIKDDSRWLIRMVENLLSITRIDEGKGAEITKTQEAVEEIIADTVSKFKKQFSDFPITVSIPDELIIIPMDAILIEQVLMNLLENAVIHSQTATEIRLSAEEIENGVRFTVSDNGSGIPQNILSHIFDGYFNPAYEKKGDTKRSMGIGLTVCNTIIKAHGGTLTAGNAVDKKGAYFTFTLPIGEE